MIDDSDAIHVQDSCLDDQVDAIPSEATNFYANGSYVTKSYLYMGDNFDPSPLALANQLMQIHQEGLVPLSNVR